MTEAESFTSLLALIDNHLSKTNIQGSRSEANNGSFAIQIPSLSGGHNGTHSESNLSPCQRLPIPRLGSSDSPITNILAEQVANMLKAKEKRQKDEEKRKIEEEMNKLAIKDDDDSGSECVIDLMQALKTPYKPGPFIEKQRLSSTSSLESLFEPSFIDCDEDYAKKKALTPEPMLPCTTDMSYMLKQKVRRGKCSPFGKVLISRYRPVAAPYFKTKVQNNIVRFNFQTKSPCDLIKEKLRKPSSYNTYRIDVAPELKNLF